MSTKYNHVVLISGGLASFEAARRVVTKFNRNDVSLLFFDTLIEDPDLYRFLNDIEIALRIRIERIVEGRNPWQVFRDERFIGNSRADPCSKKLKREVLEKELSSRFPNKNVVLYFGLDWTEVHRMEALAPKWEEKGYKVEFPLNWKPLLLHDDFKSIVERLGIQIPRLYKIGFAHNNCGGACVKAGIKQWSLLWHTFPSRYLWHERREQDLRKYLGKNISILRNRKNGKTRPMTLRVLRLRLQRLSSNEGEFLLNLDSLEEDSLCSCFVSLYDDIDTLVKS